MLFPGEMLRRARRSVLALTLFTTAAPTFAPADDWLWGGAHGG